jgi:RNA polymerase sigma-70 factor (ECF subfamily)
VARVYARSPAESADLAQDIAMAVWLALPQFRGACSERTFVFRIAHNRGIHHAERLRVRARVTSEGEASSEVADPAPGPDEALEAARRSEALWLALGRLPVGARAVLSLELEGLSHAEIAEVLGSTPNSVAVRLSRARSELRHHLTAWERGHGA